MSSFYYYKNIPENTKEASLNPIRLFLRTDAWATADNVIDTFSVGFFAEL